MKICHRSAMLMPVLCRQFMCIGQQLLHHKVPAICCSCLSGRQQHICRHASAFVQNSTTLASGTRANSHIFEEPKAEFDLDYLCNADNLKNISENIALRKGIGDIHKLQEVWKQLKQLQQSKDSSRQTDIDELKAMLMKMAVDIPNKTHPDTPIGDESQAKLIKHHIEKRDFSFKPKSVVELGTKLNVLRTRDIGRSTGPRSYYFMGSLAHMEQALVAYVLDRVSDKGFVLMSIPDLIHPSVIEACGFKTTGERNQVYKLDRRHHGRVCLAGTGEMPLAGFFMNRLLPVEELPQKVVAVSRCFRAETSELKEERGIYRVHQFTKVEMFAVTADETGRESESALADMVDTQIELFSAIGIPFRVLEMPSQELGAPAYRKYDMEAWMPAMAMWGEISSTSTCTDFQSRRLNIKYKRTDGSLQHVHTVNGTACAVPRMVMAIMENYQNEDGSVRIPRVLQPYMNGETIITKPKRILEMKYITNLKTSQKS